MDEKINALIKQCRKLEKQRDSSRVLFTLLMVAVVAVFALLAWHATMVFGASRLPDLSTAMNREIHTLSPKAVDRMTGKFAKVYPAYVTAFQDNFNKNQQTYYNTVLGELSKLENHAKQTWPKIEMAMAQLDDNQEIVIRKALEEQKIGTDEARLKAGRLYHDRLTDYITGEISMRGAAIDKSEDLIKKLERLAATEPDMPPSNFEYLSGMTLELFGIQIQETAPKTTAGTEENSLIPANAKNPSHKLQPVKNTK